MILLSHYTVDLWLVHTVSIFWVTGSVTIPGFRKTQHPLIIFPIWTAIDCHMYGLFLGSFKDHSMGAWDTGASREATLSGLLLTSLGPRGCYCGILTPPMLVGTPSHLVCSNFTKLVLRKISTPCSRPSVSSVEPPHKVCVIHVLHKYQSIYTLYISNP